MHLALPAVALAALLATACSGPPPATAQDPDPDGALRVAVLERLPHDTELFTQGLEIADGVLYEGTGLVGESRLRATPLADPSRVLTEVELPEPLFGEGLTVVDDRIWQLTWRGGVAIERDRDSLAERRRVRYDGEGWGICSQRESPAGWLVMSNGTAVLTFRDPDTFAATGTVTVRDRGRPVARLNELECTAGAVWANVWQTDRIVRIDPATGAVTATVDAAGLLTPQQRARADVLNGIAAVPGTDGEFLLTGKRWPTTFRVRFAPA
ncbi:MAG: glutaminyl-peptide cyclotransferase [Pseudonocardiaceae bacterium]